MVTKFGDYDVVLTPAIVNEDIDYISILVTSGDMSGKKLVMGKFHQTGSVEDGFGDITFDAFFDEYSQDESDELVADNSDFVQLCAMNLIQLAVKNLEALEYNNETN